MTGPRFASDQLPGPNLLINGGFRIWQRGTSFSGGPAILTADKWEIVNGTADVDQVTDSFVGQYSALVNDTDGSNEAGIENRIEEVQDLQGEVVSVACRVKQGPNSPATQAKVVIEDSDGTNVTSSDEPVDLTSSFQRVSVRHTVQEDATSLVVRLVPASASGDGSSTGEAIFDAVTLVSGSQAVAYGDVVRPVGRE